MARRSLLITIAVTDYSVIQTTGSWTPPGTYSGPNMSSKMVRKSYTEPGPLGKTVQTDIAQ